MSEELSEKSINTLLNECGYEVLKIILIFEEGEEQPRFIKALSPHAIPTYLYVDVDGFTEANNNSVYVENDNVSLINHSVKMGALKCIGPECSGVALEVGTHFCVLIPDAVKNQELNYHMRDARQATANGVSPISYTLLNISDVLGDAPMVSRNIQINSAHIRENFWRHEMEKLKKLAADVRTLNNDMNAVIKKLEETAKAHSETMSELNNYQDVYVTQAEMDEETRATAEITSKAIYCIHSNYFDTMKEVAELASHHPDVVNMQKIVNLLKKNSTERCQVVESLIG